MDDADRRRIAALAAVECDGLDPHALMDAEAARIEAFLGGLDDSEWSAATVCEDWDRRLLVCHMLAVDDYFRAGLTGTLDELFGRLMAAGAHDLDSFNAVGVTERSDRTPAQLRDEWASSNAEVRRLWREHGEDDMGTAVGQYPAPWQALHAAAEWATHADDLGVPESAAEEPDRTAWRARAARFALAEAKADVQVEGVEGGTRVSGRDIAVVLSDSELVAAVADRLPPNSAVDDAARAVLSAFGS